MSGLVLDGIEVVRDTFHLEPVSLELDDGITALIGPNGSGKSTLIRSVVGMVPTARGAAWWQDRDLTRRDIESFRSMAYVPDDQSTLFPQLTGAEMLRFHAAVRARTFHEDPAAVLERALGLVERLRLELGRERIESFSLGMKRKLQLVSALMLEPRLLIIDEPQNGLDFMASQELRALLSDARTQWGTQVLMSNHDLDSVARMADSVVVLHRGRVVGRTSQATIGAGADLERFVARSLGMATQDGARP